MSSTLTLLSLSLPSLLLRHSAPVLALGVVEAEEEEDAVAAQLGGLRLAGGAAAGEGRLTQDKVGRVVGMASRLEKA